MNLVLLGPPGAGKGTQAERVSSQLSYAHISTGEILRKAVSDKTELGLLANSYMSKGELVPDKVMIELIQQVLPKDRGFLLDGFPRTVDQAKALDVMLSKESKAISLVINIQVPRNELINRMLLRGRNDDSKETIEHRLEVYEVHTKPVINYYSEKMKLKDVDGSSSVDAVTTSIMALLR